MEFSLGFTFDCFQQWIGRHVASMDVAAGWPWGGEEKEGPPGTASGTAVGWTLYQLCGPGVVRLIEL
jgi:hypothetical protein